MMLKGKKVALLVEDLYQELEVWYLMLRFREEGAEVTVVGSGSAKEHTGKFGYPVRVDKFAHEVKADQFDAVVVPGGYAPDLMRRYPAMVSLVREAAQQEKVVAAICHGGFALGYFSQPKRRPQSVMQPVWVAMFRARGWTTLSRLIVVPAVSAPYEPICRVPEQPPLDAVKSFSRSPKQMTEHCIAGKKIVQAHIPYRETPESS
jgi:DJ-1/PfpI family